MFGNAMATLHAQFSNSKTMAEATFRWVSFLEFFLIFFSVSMSIVFYDFKFIQIILFKPITKILPFIYMS